MSTFVCSRSQFNSYTKSRSMPSDDVDEDYRTCFYSFDELYDTQGKLYVKQLRFYILSVSTGIFLTPIGVSGDGKDIVANTSDGKDIVTTDGNRDSVIIGDGNRDSVIIGDGNRDSVIIGDKDIIVSSDKHLLSTCDNSKQSSNMEDKGVKNMCDKKLVCDIIIDYLYDSVSILAWTLDQDKMIDICPGVTRSKSKKFGAIISRRHVGSTISRRHVGSTISHGQVNGGTLHKQVGDNTSDGQDTDNQHTIGAEKRWQVKVWNAYCQQVPRWFRSIIDKSLIPFKSQVLHHMCDYDSSSRVYNGGMWTIKEEIDGDIVKRDALFVLFDRLYIMHTETRGSSWVSFEEFALQHQGLMDREDMPEMTISSINLRHYTDLNLDKFCANINFGALYVGYNFTKILDYVIFK